MKIFHLFYVSTATGYVSQDTISSILEASRTNNSARGITGLLLYRSGHFAQVLEGNRETVLDVFKKISKDSRHEQCRILLEFESDAPLFPNWSMGYPEKHAERTVGEVFANITSLMKEEGSAREKLVAALKSINNGT